MSNLALHNQDLPDFLQSAGVSSLTKQLAGGGTGGVPRIVPKNGIFRKVVGGEEMGRIKGTVNAIIIAPVTFSFLAVSGRSESVRCRKFETRAREIIRAPIETYTMSSLAPETRSS